MAATVHALCALTAALCTLLLWRSWRTGRVRLLLFSALCFAGLTVNNTILFIDRVVAPDVDLGVVRLSTALASLLVLLSALIWEST